MFTCWKQECKLSNFILKISMLYKIIVDDYVFNRRRTINTRYLPPRYQFPVKWNTQRAPNNFISWDIQFTLSVRVFHRMKRLNVCRHQLRFRGSSKYSQRYLLFMIHNYFFPYVFNRRKYSVTMDWKSNFERMRGLN